ncbi:MAG: hypothetical protein M1814_006788 [Vezdaea aestivalis]|nr:MAG: hypothetical protein M1814_006788 [Vezdaea aestivalis]
MDNPETSLTDLALAPARVALSKPARRAYLTTALILSASFILYGIAVFAYSLFYMQYIPKIGLEKVVHLQFEPDQHPYALAPLGPALVSNQPYDVSVHLLLPRSPPNLATGNFMLDLSLLSAAQADALPLLPSPTDLLAHSRRPAILTFESGLVRTLKTAVGAGALALGWKREEESVDIRMLEEVEFRRGWATLPKWIRLEVRAVERVEIYRAVVKFEARFYGLRYIMYNHRILSLLLFSTIFWLTELLFALLAYLLLSTIFRPATQPIKSGPDIKLDPGTPTPTSFSDTSRSFPTTSRQQTLHYSRIKPEPDSSDFEGDDVLAGANIPPLVGEADDEDEEEDLVNLVRGGGRTDSGIGTSLDDAARGPGVQRRRSRGRGAGERD